MSGILTFRVGELPIFSVDDLTGPTGLAEYKFFKAPIEQVEIVACFELVSD